MLVFTGLLTAVESAFIIMRYSHVGYLHNGLIYILLFILCVCMIAKTSVFGFVRVICLHSRMRLCVGLSKTAAKVYMLLCKDIICVCTQPDG